MTSRDYYDALVSMGRVNQGRTEIAVLRAALAEIANRPMVERNPDGVDQAAAAMRVIARDALAFKPGTGA